VNILKGWVPCVCVGMCVRLTTHHRPTPVSADTSGLQRAHQGLAWYIWDTHFGIWDQGIQPSLSTHKKWIPRQSPPTHTHKDANV
jgi:hypothetical protein